ncbi:MAG: lytic transglycosylase domain-containing protein [Pseudomonadota bacterium]|jgi:hypothetical protein
MRIDFAGRYKEVANLLQASAKPSSSASDPAFEKDLGTLLLQEPENSAKSVDKRPTKTELYLPRQSLKDPMDDIRASFKFPETELQMTPLEPLSPPQQVSGPLTPAAQEVKTPTVLEVKRVEVPASVNISNAPQLSKQEIQTRLVSAALGAGLDPALTQAVVKAESSFNVRAVSNDGHASKGLFQLLDSTGKHLMSRADGVSKKYDPFNPDLNIKLGTNYLRYLHDIFKVPTELPNNLKTVAAADSASLERFAVAAFNAGEGRVASAQSRSEVLGKDPAYYDQVAPLLPRSTREYVKRVIEGKDNFLLAPKS